MKKAIKLLHISSSLSWRGGENQLFILFKEIEKDNSYDQKVLCPETSILSQKVDSNYRIQYKTSFLYRTSFFNSIKNFNPDIIHIHDSKSHSLIHQFLILNKSNAKVIVSKKVPTIPSIASYFKYNNSQNKRYIAVSKHVQNNLDKKVSIPINVIHDSMDVTKHTGIKEINIYKLFNIPKNKFLIGNTSAFSLQKDLESFVKIAKEIVQFSDKFHFILPGEGQEHGKIKKIIKQERLTQHISLLGFQKNILGILKNYNLFLFTSKWEGLGSSVLDAFYQNIPVVCSDIPGLNEIAIHQNTALTAKRDDQYIKNMSDQIIKIYNDNNLKNQLTKNAYELANNHRPEVFASSHKSIYKEFIS